MSFPPLRCPLHLNAASGPWPLVALTLIILRLVFPAPFRFAKFTALPDDRLDLPGQIGVYGGRAKRRRWLFIYLIGMTAVVTLILVKGSSTNDSFSAPLLVLRLNGLLARHA